MQLSLKSKGFSSGAHIPHSSHTVASAPYLHVSLLRLIYFIVEDAALGSIDQFHCCSNSFILAMFFFSPEISLISSSSFSSLVSSSFISFPL